MDVNLQLLDASFLPHFCGGMVAGLLFGDRALLWTALAIALWETVQWAGSGMDGLRCLQWTTDHIASNPSWREIAKDVIYTLAGCVYVYCSKHKIKVYERRKTQD